MYPWNNPFQPPPPQPSGSNLLQSILQQINQGNQGALGNGQQKQNIIQYLQNLFQQFGEQNKSLDQKAADNAVNQQPPMGSPPGPSGDNTSSTQQQASAPPMDITPASVGQNYYGLWTYPGMSSSYDPSPVLPSGANPSYP
jgi:hypothetical protein